MDKLQQMPGPRREQQLKAQIGIRTMKQGSTRLDIFITMFKEQRVLCEDLGLVLGEEELRSIFIGALNVEVFGHYKEAFYADEGLYPDTLDEVFIHANDFYVRKCQAFPSMASVLGDTTGYAVYSTGYEYDDGEGVEPGTQKGRAVAGIESGMKSVRLAEPPAAPALAPWAIPFPKPVCQLCEKPGHTAQTCYSFRDPETVKWFVDANAAQPGRGGRGRGRGGRHSGRGVGADQGATDGSIGDGGVFPGEPGISSVASQSNGWMGQTQPWDYSAHCVTDLTSVCATALPDGEEGLCDFEHDDHADVHILRNAVAAGFFKSTEDGECTLAGFSSNMSVVASARGSLVLD